jgi:hypothetical protein
MLNTMVLNHFTEAFSASDVKTIRELLHPEGVFFGRYSRDRVVGQFHNLFYGEAIRLEDYGFVRYRSGIALTDIPGAEMVEIRCGKKPIKTNFGDPPCTLNGERVIRLCFLFKDGKIFSMKVPKKFTTRKDPSLPQN